MVKHFSDFFSNNDNLDFLDPKLLDALDTTSDLCTSKLNEDWIDSQGVESQKTKQIRWDNQVWLKPEIEMYQKPNKDQVKQSSSFSEIIILIHWLISIACFPRNKISDLRKVMRDWYYQLIPVSSWKEDGLEKVTIEWVEYYLKVNPKLNLDNYKEIALKLLDKINSTGEKSFWWPDIELAA